MISHWSFIAFDRLGGVCLDFIRNFHVKMATRKYIFRHIIFLWRGEQKKHDTLRHFQITYGKPKAAQENQQTMIYTEYLFIVVIDGSLEVQREAIRAKSLISRHLSFESNSKLITHMLCILSQRNKQLETFLKIYKASIL